MTRRRAAAGPRAKRAPVAASPDSPAPAAVAPEQATDEREQAGVERLGPGRQRAALKALVGFHDAVLQQFGGKRR